MKTILISPQYRRTVSLQSTFTVLIFAIFFGFFCNFAQAQQTLCQQFGGNFVPEILIGIKESSVTTTANLNITGWTNKKIVVFGTLIVNSDFKIQSCTLQMGKNARIQVAPNVTFSSTFSKYFRCGSDLWTGFQFLGGTNGIWFNHIEDAATAMNIMSANANVVIVGNVVNRNLVGVSAIGIALNAIFAANTFDCTSPINGSTSSMAEFGIRLVGCPSASIGRTELEPGYRNIFRRHKTGISISNSTATIGLSTFDHNTTGLFAQLSNVTMRGASAGLTSHFLFNNKDVNTSGSSLNLFHCFLERCETSNITSSANNNQQQVHIHDNTIHVSNEPSAANSKMGISLDRSRFGSADQFRNTIDRNHFVIESFGGNERRAMHVRGGLNMQDFMRIDSNFIDVMSGGNSSLLTKIVDIDISGADNFRVTRNTLRSNNTFGSGNNRWGFFMVNGATTPSKGNFFTNNDISGVGSADDGCCAVHAENAGPWSICSNKTNNTYRGFHIVGNCGESSFGLNDIGNHNVDPLNLYVGGTGVFLQGHGSDNVFLGDQECQGNYWDITDYSLPNAYTAIIHGAGTNSPSIATILKNEFIVADLNDPHQAPIDRNPMQGWFKSIPCLQTPTECVEPEWGRLDENDEWVRNNYPMPQLSPEVEEWQSTRYVLAKLMRYPALATGDALVFKNAYAQSSAALFARFDSLMNAVSLATAVTQFALSNLEADMLSKQVQITLLDASITDYTNLESGLLSNRATLLNELAVLSEQYKDLLVQNNDARAPFLDACEQFNNALPANQVYEQNQKILNALYLKQTRSIELNQSDIDALHAIAQQCLQTAGRTKSAAASMLPNGGAQYWRENPDEYICQQRGERSGNLRTNGVLLSPNPCSDILRVQFESPFTGDITISDLSGRVIEQQQILDLSQTLDVLVGHLNSGVYILSSSSIDGGLPINAKFVVIR